MLLKGAVISIEVKQAVPDRKWSAAIQVEALVVKGVWLLHLTESEVLREKMLCSKVWLTIIQLTQGTLSL